MGFGGSSGTSSISGASDANVSNPTTNNVLVYSSVGKWTNQALVGTAALPTGGGLETVVTNSSVTGATTLNIATANVFSVTLTGNATYTFTGATTAKACAFSVYQQQDSTGSRTVTWPTAVKWAGGTAPTLTATANAIDLLVFESIDGGTTWYGSLVGANFS